MNAAVDLDRGRRNRWPSVSGNRDRTRGDEAGAGRGGDLRRYGRGHRSAGHSARRLPARTDSQCGIERQVAGVHRAWHGPATGERHRCRAGHQPAAAARGDRRWRVQFGSRRCARSDARHSDDAHGAERGTRVDQPAAGIARQRRSRDLQREHVVFRT